MSLLDDDLARWKHSGAISTSQHDAIAAIVSKERFSIFTELTALLYLGVVSLVAGVGWTARSYFAKLGDITILAGIAIACVAAIGYCFVRGGPYSNERREATGFGFDYVLYFGCLMLGVELGYLEFRFHLLQDNWDHYLLISSIVYFALAYRFDNEIVLSLALSTLAGWFGFRLVRWPWIPGSLRVYALAYAATVALVGHSLWRARVKAHFLQTYLHVAVNVSLAALASGVMTRPLSVPYFAGLIVVAAASIAGGLKFGRFAFVIYGVIYAYVGVSDVLMDGVRSGTLIALYFTMSATAVVISLVLLARRFGRTA
jgi:predicted membrane protein DUF2157